jgi:hypothetical protein
MAEALWGGVSVQGVLGGWFILMPHTWVSPVPQKDRLMVSDALAMQYILNSGHFALSPFLQNMGGLVYGDGNLFGLRGKLPADIRTLP